MSEHVINEQTYNVGKMPVMQQMHVGRRVMPMMREFFEGDSEDEASMKLADAISSLTNKNLNYITNRTLAVVRRKIDGDQGWAPVWASPEDPEDDGQSMFSDITPSIVTALIILVCKDNLSGFFGDLLSGSLTKMLG